MSPTCVSYAQPASASPHTLLDPAARTPATSPASEMIYTGLAARHSSPAVSQGAAEAPLGARPPPLIEQPMQHGSEGEAKGVVDVQGSLSSFSARPGWSAWSRRGVLPSDSSPSSINSAKSKEPPLLGRVCRRSKLATLPTLPLAALSPLLLPSTPLPPPAAPRATALAAATPPLRYELHAAARRAGLTTATRHSGGLASCDVRNPTTRGGDGQTSGSLALRAVPGVRRDSHRDAPVSGSSDAGEYGDGGPVGRSSAAVSVLGLWLLNTSPYIGDGCRGS
jgi:hypothetical protein